MPRPCDHAGQPPRPGCAVCDLYAARPDYQRLWREGDVPPPRTHKPRVSIAQIAAQKRH